MADIELQKEYQQRFEQSQEYRNRVWRIFCRDYFGKLIPKSSTVLDLGAGWCEFINNIEAAKKYAMDMNPDTAKRKNDDVVFFHQDCSEAWPLPDQTLDVVFTSNFLEHLPDKRLIQKAMGEARRCLKPGGLIVCLGPNITYTGGLYWDFWDHYIPLTEKSIAEALTLEDFKIQKKIDRFLPFTMSNGKEPPAFFVKAYLKLPFAWRFFGKQFLVVGKK